MLDRIATRSDCFLDSTLADEKLNELSRACARRKKGPADCLLSFFEATEFAERPSHAELACGNVSEYLLAPEVFGGSLEVAFVHQKQTEPPCCLRVTVCGEVGKQQRRSLRATQLEIRQREIEARVVVAVSDWLKQCDGGSGVTQAIAQ